MTSSCGFLVDFQPFLSITFLCIPKTERDGGGAGVGIFSGQVSVQGMTCLCLLKNQQYTLMQTKD